MFRDKLPTYSSPQLIDLSVTTNHEVAVILDFIDRNIQGFPPYYHRIKDSVRENRISDFLVHHFQLCKDEQSDGFSPYDFRKNPTQSHSGRETDIGVFVLTRSHTPVPIIEFEAKRFSETSNNKEYVCGERGGIERFKRGHHSSHHSVCGMFGYVLSRTSKEWIEKVNGWITEQAQNNTYSDIDWKSSDEKLRTTIIYYNVEKLRSEHTRKQTNNKILIWHYFINLC